MGIKKVDRERLNENEKKWTRPLMDAGWTVLPSVLLERQRALALDATDLNIVLHLVRHWFHADRLPYPSKRTIADCMGIDESTVRRRIAKMEADGLLRREQRFGGRGGAQQTNLYRFDGLIKAATPLAQEQIETRQQRKVEDADRRTRKRPRLRLVSKGDKE